MNWIWDEYSYDSTLCHSFPLFPILFNVLNMKMDENVIYFSPSYLFPYISYLKSFTKWTAKRASISNGIKIFRARLILSLSLSLDGRNIISANTKTRTPKPRRSCQRCRWVTLLAPRACIRRRLNAHSARDASPKNSSTLPYLLRKTKKSSTKLGHEVTLLKKSSKRVSLLASSVTLSCSSVCTISMQFSAEDGASSPSW